MIGTRAISGSPAISFRKRTIAAWLSSMASSMLMSMICAPFSTCWRATASASSNSPSRIIRAKAFEPVTLVRSPMLTNSAPSPMVTGSRPDRRSGGEVGGSHRRSLQSRTSAVATCSRGRCALAEPGGRAAVATLLGTARFYSPRPLKRRRLSDVAATGSIRYTVQEDFPMTNAPRRLAAWFAALTAALALQGCGYNDFQRLDEQVKAAWSEVLNQYQRRADLIPNIVATVKGEANFEQETLTKVIEARARATGIQATPELINNPEAFDKFQKAQGELSGALSRLMATVEQYPNLKANAAFQDLRVQLEGTENRITVARNRYIKTVADYNVLARSFPTNLTAMIFSYARQAQLHRAERSPDLGAAGGQLRQGGTMAARGAPRSQVHLTAGRRLRQLALLLSLLLAAAVAPGPAARRSCCRCRRSAPA